MNLVFHLPSHLDTDDIYEEPEIYTESIYCRERPKVPVADLM